jgi:hypothetical protein
MSESQPKNRRARSRASRRDRDSLGGREEPSGPSTATPPDTLALGVDWTARWPGWVVLWCGWLLPQLALLGPALLGRTAMAPVEVLNCSGAYLPLPVGASAAHDDKELWDLVSLFQPFRHFAATEIRAGRLPTWEPANYAGAPFAGWPKYSPFELVYDLAPSNITLAFIQLLQSILLGSGLWLFLRRGLNLSYWPAAIAGWCAPLTGFVTLWQGYPVVVPVYWLPWLLLLARQTVTRPGRWSNLALSVVTGLLLLCGAVDVCGLVLLATGLYAIWLLCFESGPARWRSRSSAAAGLSAAWVAGFLLAAPYLVPLAEYVQTGSRIQARGAGHEERPPIGLRELGPVVLPNMYGSTCEGSYRLVDSNRFESSSSAYAGLLAVFWLAPLAWCDKRRRRETLFFVLLAVLGMSWALDIPGPVQIMRQKPLNMLSYNRWVFATSLAFLVLAAIGLEQLRGGKISFRYWFLIPIALTAACGCFCLFRALDVHDWLSAAIEESVHWGASKPAPAALQIVEENFKLYYALGAGLSLAAVVGWLTTFVGGVRAGWLRVAVVALLPAELFWFAAHETRQGDISLYYPPVPALEYIASKPAGRIWGVDCLPPNLNLVAGLQDVRGYDAVDPALFVRLFSLACDASHKVPEYAATQMAIPELITGPLGLKLHPVADLLNVRYLVTRAQPPAQFPVTWHQDDYWILENRYALSRAFIPRNVRVVESDAKALEIMSDAAFKPQKVAMLSSGTAGTGDMEGTATIRYESPTRAHLEADMRTDGMVVVSDMWDPDWYAQVDGTPCPIERVDVALRGIRVPAGKHSIEMTYDPPSVRRGFELAAAGALALLAWLIVLLSLEGRRRAKVKSKK